jgi:hypothetical protein
MIQPPFSKSPINVFLFTLSGFPFHINLKHLLSISFLYIAGITHELTIKVVAMNEIEIFGNFSGLMINRNKTEGLWIGKLKHSKGKVEILNGQTNQ